MKHLQPFDLFEGASIWDPMNRPLDLRGNQVIWDRIVARDTEKYKNAKKLFQEDIEEEFNLQNR